MSLRFVLVAILLFYIWIPGSWVFNFHLDHGGSGDYISHNHLAEAFLAGKLNLFRDPDPRLSLLLDPYEPSQTAPYKWHDASVYKGKHYLYFGPVPTIVLYVPFKLLTQATMSDTFALLFFTFGIFIWNTLTLIHLKRLYFNNIPKWLFLTAIIVLGLANSGTHTMHRHGGIYHINIASGCFFLSGGLYWIIRSIERNTFNIKHLALGGLFFGLACGSRPHLLLSGLIILITLFKFRKDSSHFNYQEKLYRFFALIIPFIVCLFLIGLYNYLRFNDFTEFGFKYQTGDLNVQRISPLDLDGFASNLYMYFFLPPSFNLDFPFFRPTFPNMTSIHKKFYVQPVFGILYGVPFLWLPLLGLLLLKLTGPTSKNTLPKFELVLIASSALINLLPNLVYSGCAIRFVIEFLNPILLFAIVLWFYLYLLLMQKLKHLLIILTMTLSIISSVIGMSFGADTMSFHDAHRLKPLKKVFKPLSDVLVLIFTPKWDYVAKNVEPVRIATVEETYSHDGSRTYNVIDGDLKTDWAVPIKYKNTTVSLSFGLYAPEKIKSIWLLSRYTQLCESWKKIEVKFYLRNNLVSEKLFFFPHAEKHRVQHLILQPITADIITFTFFDPITKDLQENERDPGTLSPGYTEIVFEKCT